MRWDVARSMVRGRPSTSPVYSQQYCTLIKPADRGVTRKSYPTAHVQHTHTSSLRTGNAKNEFFEDADD